MWNELDYSAQTKIINKLFTLLVNEDDFDMRQGILAAINELEIWSNAPIKYDEQYIAEALYY